MPSTKQSSSPELILPSIGKPKWKRTFNSVDIKPALLSPVSTSQKDKTTIGVISTTTTTTCPICNKHETRYTCPKCLTPFCSVECYRKHDLPLPPEREGENDEYCHTVNDNDSSNRGAGGGMCTEHFYRKKVKEVCNLDVRADSNVSQMKDILTRSFYNSSNDDDDNEIAEPTVCSSNYVENQQEGNRNKNELTEEELVELATHVLSIKDLEDAEEYGEVKKENDSFDYNKIPEHLRFKFEQAVQRGELSHLIEEWHPYWLPDYNITNSGVYTEESFYDQDECDGHIETLDERLLSIQKLVKLQKSSSSKSLKLQYNICELVYTTAMILRLYNGGRATKKQKYVSRTDGSIDADSIYVDMNSASDLYSQSFVLSKDERYTNISAMFMDCILHKKNNVNRPYSQCVTITDDVDWKVLMNDCICICRSKRMVMRVLFHTIDILKNGLISIKKMKSGDLTGYFQFSGENDPASKKKAMKLAKKKVEYYISWIASNWDLVGSDIVSDITTWIDDWTSKEEDRMNMSGATIMGSIAATKDTSRQKELKISILNKDTETHAGPLLRAVTTKKK